MVAEILLLVIPLVHEDNLPRVCRGSSSCLTSNADVLVKTAKLANPDGRAFELSKEIPLLHCPSPGTTYFHAESLCLSLWLVVVPHLFTGSCLENWVFSGKSPCRLARPNINSIPWFELTIIMMSYCTRDITKEVVRELPAVPVPESGRVLQVRTGKVQRLAQERSAIFKTEVFGPVYVGLTGITGDEHFYHEHGGTERAIMMYDAAHYADWRQERCTKPELFDLGGFGENIVCTGLSENTVCVGDIYQVGEQVILEVSEPRNPCYKLNLRFEWPRALKRITRTGRVGWMLRVKQTGYVSPGDTIRLIERPYPRWSCLSVKRVIQAKEVTLPLIQELTEVSSLTELVRNYALKRLEKTPKRYELVASEVVTPRVKRLTFKLKEPFNLVRPAFSTFAFAQITFGDEKDMSRSYSIVSGDMNQFSLGIALDDNSRGGSAYLHRRLKVGNEILMSVGGSPKALEDEHTCIKDGLVERRLVIIGGIGVTALLPSIMEWEAQELDYEVHYAVRSRQEAVFIDLLPATKTITYAKDEDQRLNLGELIPAPSDQGLYTTRIYCCGPSRLMDAAELHAKKLGYPDHMLHFESFGADAGESRAEPFSVEVKEMESGRRKHLSVPADKSLLQTLREAGFDMAALCEVGGCGSCKVTLCEGEVVHKGNALYESEKQHALLTCVSRGVGRIKIELD